MTVEICRGDHVEIFFLAVAKSEGARDNCLAARNLALPKTFLDTVFHVRTGQIGFVRAETEHKTLPSFYSSNYEEVTQ